ncbi:hypothetical protein BDZ97DRAFT_428102 [Flammula alnicola]|nr:hypothetical protein BDZ97DRAFT_428102 [Flammula alnicola]
MFTPMFTRLIVFISLFALFAGVSSKPTWRSRRSLERRDIQNIVTGTKTLKQFDMRAAVPTKRRRQAASPLPAFRDASAPAPADNLANLSVAIVASVDPMKLSIAGTSGSLNPRASRAERTDIANLAVQPSLTAVPRGIIPEIDLTKSTAAVASVKGRELVALPASIVGTYRKLIVFPNFDTFSSTLQCFSPFRLAFYFYLSLFLSFVILYDRL